MVEHVADLSGAEMARPPGHSSQREAGFPLYTLGCLLEGCSEVRWAGGSFARQAPSLSLVPPGLAYSLHVPVAHRQMWICFAPRVVWQPWLTWGLAGPSPLDRPFLPVPASRTGELIVAGLREALASQAEGTCVGHRLAELALEQVLIRAAGLAQAGEGGDRLQALIEEMRGDLAGRWSTRRMARAAGLSESRFTHLFTQRYGRSPMRHLLRMRMDTAKALLFSTSMPVCEVAACVGFTDPLHFSRRFHGIAGRSPTQFRSQPAAADGSD